MDGHIKLTDFGLSRLNVKRNELNTSICGSPEYMCPEMLNQGFYTRMLDFYQIGALLYEILTGLPPNYQENKNQMLKNIVSQEPVYPNHLSSHARHLLKGLLHKDPQKRLGYENEFIEIKTHPFFTGLNWQKVERKEYKGPLKISLDKLYFDKEFVLTLTSEEISEMIADVNTGLDILKALPREHEKYRVAIQSARPLINRANRLSMELDNHSEEITVMKHQQTQNSYSNYDLTQGIGKSLGTKEKDSISFDDRSDFNTLKDSAHFKSHPGKEDAQRLFLIAKESRTNLHKPESRIHEYEAVNFLPSINDQAVSSFLKYEQSQEPSEILETEDINRNHEQHFNRHSMHFTNAPKAIMSVLHEKNF